MFKTNYTLLLASRGRPVCTNSGAHPGRAPGGGGRCLPGERHRPPPRRGSREGMRGPRRPPIPGTSGRAASSSGGSRRCDRLPPETETWAAGLGGVGVSLCLPCPLEAEPRPPGALRRWQKAGWARRVAAGPLPPLQGPGGGRPREALLLEILVENLLPCLHRRQQSAARDLTLIHAMTKKL